MKTMQTLYPTRRHMTEQEIVQWAHDLFDDSAPRRRCGSCGVVTVAVKHGQPEAPVRPGEYLASDPNHPCNCVADSVAVHDDDQHCPHGLDECAAYLEDLGVVTFRRAR